MTTPLTTFTIQRPVLVLVRGLPGSGKSFICGRLRDALGADTVVLLDPDATNHDSPDYLDLSRQLTQQGVDARFHPYRFLRAQAYRGIETGKVIVWNQAFTDLDGFTKTIVNLQAYAIEHAAQLPVLVVEVAINPAVARARVQQRAAAGGHDVNDEAFERFTRDYHSFMGQGFRVVEVDGEADPEESVQGILRALQEPAG